MAQSQPVVYIIEDEPAIAEYMRSLLEPEGVRCVTYTDGIPGMQACLADPPDLLILDFGLPQLGGEHVLRLLRSSPGHHLLPIMVCSATSSAQRREQEVLRIGADAYLAKPFRPEDFLAYVRPLLEKSLGASQANKMRRRRSDEDTEDSLDPVAGPGGYNISPEATTPLAFDYRRHQVNDKTHGSQTNFHGDALSSQARVPRGTSTVRDPRMPARLGQYEILDLIGGGAMGTVYRARDVRDDKTVALKVLLRSLKGVPKVVERFQREARIMERISHPNIIRIFESGGTPYSFYIAMEYVAGETLCKRVQRIPLSWEEMQTVIPQLFDAICYLHDHQILHRDIKPQNIMIAKDGALKVTDFGVSCGQSQTGKIEDAQGTQNCDLVGTPRYMAPEQLLGAPANVWTDQYALGRTVLALFEGGTSNVPPHPLHEIRPDLPRELSDAIARCMNVHPSERFPTLHDASKAMCKALRMAGVPVHTPAWTPIPV